MAAEKVVEQLKQRAAMIWDITPDAVDWRDALLPKMARFRRERHRQ